MTSVPSVVTLPNNSVIFRDLLPSGQLVYQALSIAEYSANGEPLDNWSDAHWRYSNRVGNIAQDQYLEASVSEAERIPATLQGVTCNQDREHLQSRRIPASKYSAQKVRMVSFSPTRAKKSLLTSSFAPRRRRLRRTVSASGRRQG